MKARPVVNRFLIHSREEFARVLVYIYIYIGRLNVVSTLEKEGGSRISAVKSPRS